MKVSIMKFYLGNFLNFTCLKIAETLWPIICKLCFDISAVSLKLSKPQAKLAVQQIKHTNPEVKPLNMDIFSSFQQREPEV